MSAVLQSAFSTTRLLERICEAIQLSRTQHERAVSSYQHVGDWLCKVGSIVRPLRPRVRPQGSMLLRTTVRPWEQHEFDLDLVCLLKLLDPRLVSASHAYELVAARIEEHADLKKRMTRLPRCIRLSYAGDFHLDVIVACYDPRPGRALMVPRRIGNIEPTTAWESWKETDPFGYAAWFEGQNARRAGFAGARASVEPAPGYEPVENKTPLRKVTQLVKHRRNMAYTPEAAPSSILLTTMASEEYYGEEFSLETNIEVIGRMRDRAEREGDDLEVLNPTIPEENFAEPLGVSGKRRFRDFLATYHTELLVLQDIRRIDRVSDAMERMYERDIVKRAVGEVSDELTGARSAGSLYTGRNGVAPLVIVTGAAKAALVQPRPNPPHQFFGGPCGS